MDLKLYSQLGSMAAENARASPTYNPRGYRFESLPRQNQFNKKNTNGIPDSKKVHLSMRNKRTFELVKKALLVSPNAGVYS